MKVKASLMYIPGLGVGALGEELRHGGCGAGGDLHLREDGVGAGVDQLSHLLLRQLLVHVHDGAAPAHVTLAQQGRLQVQLADVLEPVGGWDR